MDTEEALRHVRSLMRNKRIVLRNHCSPIHIVYIVVVARWRAHDRSPVLMISPFRSKAHRVIRLSSHWKRCTKALIASVTLLLFITTARYNLHRPPCRHFRLVRLARTRIHLDHRAAAHHLRMFCRGEEMRDSGLRFRYKGEKVLVVCSRQPNK